jgi:hypothetical protein
MGQYYIPLFLADKTPEQKKEIIRVFMEAYNYNNGAKLTEHSYINNEFVSTVEYHLTTNGMFYKSRFVWAGDYADKEPDLEENLYHIAHNTKDKFLAPPARSTKEYFYIVNHTKKEYVDKKKHKIIHPLPLLTAEGNGRGGGDYHGKGEDIIGIWARDVISVEKEIPDAYAEFLCEFEDS